MLINRKNDHVINTDKQMISATTESSEPEQFTGDDSNGEGRGCLLPHQPPADRTLILIGRIFAAVFFVLFVLICCFVLSQIYFDKRFTDDVAYAKKWILAAAAEQEIMETQQVLFNVSKLPRMGWCKNFKKSFLQILYFSSNLFSGSISSERRKKW